MLHENIKTARKNRGLTQEEVAARLSVVRQTVSKWENGASVPDADSLMRLAVLLNTSVEDLLGMTLKSIEAEDEASVQREIARQLAMQNELMAEEIQRKRQFWRKLKKIAMIVLVSFVLLILLSILAFSLFSWYPGGGVSEESRLMIQAIS